MFFRVDQHIDLIIDYVEKAILNKYTIQKSKNMSKDISDIFGTSVLISSQNLLRKFL